MKKFLIIVLVFLLVLSCFSGCQTAADIEQTPTTEPDDVQLDAEPSQPSEETDAAPEQTDAEQQDASEDPLDTEAPADPTDQQHTHSYRTTTVAATCTAKGYTEHICSLCAESYRDSYTDALGHSFGAAATVAPTCTAQGYTEKTCTRCGTAEKSGYVAALGHSYASVVVAATTSSEGYTEYTCSRCGASYRDNYTEKLRWDTEECIRQICADMNAYIASLGLTVDPTAGCWVAPPTTRYYTTIANGESAFRAEVKGWIDLYREDGFTNMYVSYELGSDGYYIVYVKHALLTNQ